ncbi:MAG: 16S rRNA (uracil(1498)-N(3))-methyltransferase [Erysipelothrix sp.]|nr:16S rRNA (uracil(1498)-N(3))-methyltransferase [Erysipelothrix sp.]
MQQYFVQQKLTIDTEIEMSPQQSFHILKVLRMKEGKVIRLVDPQANVFLGSIKIIKDTVLIRVNQSVSEKRESAVKITLAIAMIKGDRWDWLLEKATECGVDTIVPFISARCVIKDKPESIVRKLERYRKIMTEAAEQSYRHQVPTIGEPVSLKKLIDHKSAANFVAYEKEDSIFLARHKEPLTTVTVVIGPEGGFTHEEISFLQDHGFISVSLGKRIFRSETAAVAACIILDTLGERNE